MKMVVDTSAVIAVVADEPHRTRLIEITRGVELLAPGSLHWEIGNAFSAMFKRGRITLEQAIAAVRSYEQIPIRFSDVDLEAALELAVRLDLYAYDAYVLACALQHRSPLLSLDERLLDAARKVGVTVVEVGA
jgi:predicted nucleic acid-binding protein